MPPTKTGPALLDALSQATDDDLMAVQQELEELKTKMATLRVLHALLRTKLGVPSKPRGKKTSPTRLAGPVDNRTAGARNVRTAAARVLMRVSHMKLEILAGELGVEPDALRTVLNASPWFLSTSQGWHVTPDGRQANQ